MIIKDINGKTLFNDSLIETIQQAIWALGHYNLIRANFNGNSCLTSTNFSNSDLREADFRGADIRWCDFTCADLKGADFRGATGIETAHFTAAKVTGAKFDEGVLQSLTAPYKVYEVVVATEDEHIGEEYITARSEKEAEELWYSDYTGSPYTHVMRVEATNHAVENCLVGIEALG